MVLNKFVYSESQATFFKDVTNGMFLDKMREAAKDCDLRVSDSELISWKNNASKVIELLKESDLNDAYVAFECMLPYTRLRVDCMLFGRDALNQGNVVHVELKQWSNRSVKATDCSANFRVDEISKEEDRVQAYIGGEEQLVAHPSQQVRGYNDYLMGFIEVLSNEKVKVKGVAYCYNYNKNISPNVLYDEKYTVLQEKYRTYAQEEMGNLASYLHEALGNGGGRAVFNEFVNSPIHPSKKLIESAASLIHEGNESEFALVGEQIIARNVIFDVIRKKKQKKTVVIVQGGPGTGKTVIALHVFSLLSKKVNDSNRRNHIRYVTKSKSLLEGVRDQLPYNRITKVLFSNILCLHPSRCEQNSIDVLLIDEAQRLSEDANIPSMPINKRTELAQIDTVLRASKISVFFIDDKQVIRGLDVGSSELIRTCAQKYGADIEEIELKSQFRCNGSNNYLDWLEQILYEKPVTSSFREKEFDFQIFNTPKGLYEEIEKQNNVEGQTARLVAGFCWPWSKALDADGDLVKDVVIGNNFGMPWETHYEIKIPPKGYVEWYRWAFRPEGIKQVGCIYTAQGFEFDYIGVIIGLDLRYDPEKQCLITECEKNKDSAFKYNKNNFNSYVRNIYRVLMSRGMKGCYVFCYDEELRKFLATKQSEYKKVLF